MLDHHISRVIGFQIALFVMALLLGSSLLVMRLLGWTPDKPAFLVSMLAVTTVLSLSFDHARRRIQSTVDRIFDRPFVAFRDTLRGVDQTLASTPNPTSWAQTLCAQFSDALAVKPVALCFREGQSFRIATHDPLNALAALPTEFDHRSPLLTYLESCVAPEEGNLLAHRFGLIVSPRGGTKVADLPGTKFLRWPIHAHGTLQAVLVFGAKEWGFTPEDIEMVALASHQIGPPSRTSYSRAGLQQLSRASLQARDDERRRISRDLHDHIVQPLIGLNYALGSIREIPVVDEVRTPAQRPDQPRPAHFGRPASPGPRRRGCRRPHVVSLAPWRAKPAS